MKQVRRALVVALVIVCFGTGATSANAARGSKVTGTVTVFAASSLTEAFTRMGRQFERKYPGTTVTFNFLASSELATQIQQGAPADAFASADEANMQKVVDSGDVGPGTGSLIFARNRLEIVVEEGNPKKIKTLADLARPDLVVVLCADAVPCGKYAAEAFTKAVVTVNPTSKAESAKAVVTTVSTGEADAGVVYATDVMAGKGSVGGVKIADSVNVTAKYPIAVFNDPPNRAGGGKAWVLFVRSKKGQKTLQEFGFLAP